ncbi:aspartate/glutamate racemase family protein [Marinobacterium rhizophilum]|uniref:Aspartate/glutamate racemase family protein n=1 Tax=Marinobacterium rhizophilum TaxID=420402 RepID=A0ABY5HK83_9GAMM|nr:amino acid racemase [Marinobacterium rhizophilum]UTW12793.1 aspartate/glutamate racemase family protein [Marinobacterium rhizophilum]
MHSTIGILGGMGPLATVDFVTKIIRQTPASRDQDHVPLLIHSVPQIPDRTACLMEGRESPLAALSQGLNTLVTAGAGCIAIPCNTAHYWHPDLAKISPVPILHIARACAEQLSANGVSRVGLMATDGTLKAGFYGDALGQYGIELVEHSALLQQRVMEGIYRVKSGALHAGARLLEDCLQQFLDSGVERVILGCTEIPLALDSIQSPLGAYGVDATDALARACIAWYQAQQDQAVAA